MTAIEQFINLPIRMISKNSINSCPFLATKKTFIYVKIGETPLEFLKRFYGKDVEEFEMDCCIFIQFISQFPTYPVPWVSPVWFRIPDTMLNTNLMWKKLPSYVGYISPANKKVRVELSTMMTSNKGQWVAETTAGSGNYIGLDENGICVKTLDEWINSTVKALKDFSEPKIVDVFFPNHPIIEERKMVNSFFEMNLLDEWILFKELTDFINYDNGGVKESLKDCKVVVFLYGCTDSVMVKLPVLHYDEKDDNDAFINLIKKINLNCKLSTDCEISRSEKKREKKILLKSKKTNPIPKNTFFPIIKRNYGYKR